MIGRARYRETIQYGQPPGRWYFLQHFLNGGFRLRKRPLVAIALRIAYRRTRSRHPQQH
jgi:hypothetical protein